MAKRPAITEEDAQACAEQAAAFFALANMRLRRARGDNSALTAITMGALMGVLEAVFRAQKEPAPVFKATMLEALDDVLDIVISDESPPAKAEFDA